MRSANIQFDLEIPNLLGVLDKLNAGAIEVEEKEVEGNTSFLKNYTLYSGYSSIRRDTTSTTHWRCEFCIHWLIDSPFD